MQTTNKNWLCVLNPKFKDFVIENDIYALNRNTKEYSLKNMKLMRKNDTILLYVTKPISGVIGIYQVTTEFYIEKLSEHPFDIDYPFRVNIKQIINLIDKTISIKDIAGKVKQIKTRKSSAWSNIFLYTPKDGGS